MVVSLMTGSYGLNATRSSGRGSGEKNLCRCFEHQKNRSKLAMVLLCLLVSYLYSSSTFKACTVTFAQI